MQQALDMKLLSELIGILQEHCGERGNSEGASDTLRRIINERDGYELSVSRGVGGGGEFVRKCLSPEITFDSQ